MFLFRISVALLALWFALEAPGQATRPAKAPKQGKPAAAKPKQAATAPALSQDQPEVLTNDAIVRMVAAGLDEDTMVEKIRTSAADFALSADDLIRLKEAKIPQRVLRAMLAKKSPAPQAQAAPVVEAAVEQVIKDPGPSAITAPPAEPVADVPSVPEQVIVRQLVSVTPLRSKAQKILFIKSEAGDVASAVANVLLSDVGLQLLTMGLSSQMSMWNPYMGDTIARAASLGKGMLLNRGSSTKGFEIETLPGLTADVTLKPAKAEFFMPLAKYVPSADFDAGAVEPVLLRLAAHDKDQHRILSGRKVQVKQEKKGRFDFKPDAVRHESEVEQTIVPIMVERLPQNVLRITTRDSLAPGEYGLVLRKKDASGALAANVALKPDAPVAGAAPSATTTAIPGMTPEMMAMMDPAQVAEIQRQIEQQTAAAQPRGGFRGRFGRGSSTAAPAPPGDVSVAGFLVWDFRVMP